MERKKIDKRKIRGLETKKKILEVAEKMFEEGNFSDVMIEDITNEVGITKGAFYVHFESKDALIALLVSDRTSRVDIDYKTFYEELPVYLTSIEALLHLTEKIADILSQSFGREIMKKVYQLMLTGAVDTKTIIGQDRELFQLISSIIDKGMKKGEIINTLPSDVIAAHFISSLRGVTFEWCIRHPDYDLKEQFLLQCKLLLNGIALN